MTFEPALLENVIKPQGKLFPLRKKIFLLLTLYMRIFSKVHLFHREKCKTLEKRNTKSKAFERKR